MGNSPDKIVKSEDEFNIEYLYELEKDPNYQPATAWVDKAGPKLNSRDRQIALNWIYQMRTNMNLPMSSAILAVYIMDAYCSTNNVKNLNEIKKVCLFLAHNCTNVEKMSADDLYDNEMEFGFMMKNVMEHLGGRIIRPTPSFFIYNATGLQNHLIYLALYDERIALYKPSVIAETVKYMTSDDEVEYSHLSEESKDICYVISEIVNGGKKYNFVPDLDLAVDNILSHKNFKRRCSVFVEAAGSVKKSTKIENLPVFKTPYKKLGVLGSGISGEVHKINRRGTELAVKLQDSVYFEEVSILALLSKSKYIIKLEGFLPESIDASFLFFEIGNYDLKSAIDKHNYPNKSEKELLEYFKQILQGLTACEYYNVIHADIKPDNIVWFEKEKRYKLIDFGLAISMSSHREHLIVEVCTAMFRPPEVFLSNGVYDHKIDVWSAGCVLYHMVTGRYYVDYTKLSTQKDMFKFIFKDQCTPTEEMWPGVTKFPNYGDYSDPIYPENPNFLSEIPKNKNLCYAIIKSCLTMNPKQRPSAKNLLSCVGK